MNSNDISDFTEWLDKYSEGVNMNEIQTFISDKLLCESKVLSSSLSFSEIRLFDKCGKLVVQVYANTKVITAGIEYCIDDSLEYDNRFTLIENVNCLHVNRQVIKGKNNTFLGLNIPGYSVSIKETGTPGSVFAHHYIKRNVEIGKNAHLVDSGLLDIKLFLDRAYGDKIVELEQTSSRDDKTIDEFYYGCLELLQRS